MTCLNKHRSDGEKKARNVRSGSYPLKNLKFLYDFAAEMNLTVGDLAARMGLSRQSVYYWFKKDDVKISNIYRLFDLLGYEIRFSLTDMKDEANPNVKVTSKLYSPEESGFPYHSSQSVPHQQDRPLP